MITIRQAVQKDLDQLAELFNRYRLFCKQEEDVAGAREFLRLRIANKESEIIVADENNVLIGFTQLYPIFSSVRMQKSWLLNDLFVEQSHRGLGISKELLKAAQQLAKESKAAGLFLETEKTNTIANKLYPVAGFQITDTINYYFWANEEKE